MVPQYNIYGLAENLRGFRIPNNFSQTFWNAYNLGTSIPSKRQSCRVRILIDVARRE